MKLKSLFSKLKLKIRHKHRYPWCKECVPSCIIEGWTSGNSEIDNFIKDTIYNAKFYYSYPLFLEWVPFDRFEDIKQIGEGGFAKVYSAKWIDGRSKYSNQDNGSWKKLEPEPINVALKRLNGSQNMSAEYLNEVYFILYFYFEYFYINSFKFNVKNSLKHIGVYSS
jgi:serine/threonine protein kinase